MQAIQASEFKAKCLALMDDVARSGNVLIVTKNGPAEYYNSILYPLQNRVLAVFRNTSFYLSGGTALSRGYNFEERHDEYGRNYL